jgi:hypothetical protein
VKLSVAVMAHRKREHLIPELVDRLGIGDDQVLWDRKGDRWDTGRRAWEAHDPAATHHLVLQDDALVCRDLIAGLEVALDHVPADALVSPYTGTRRPLSGVVEKAVGQARAADAAWIVMRALNWGVGIVAPTPSIDDMLRWGDRQSYPNYDRRVGRYYYLVTCWPVWCTWPSLIDHRADTSSLCGHGPGRVAHEFTGEDRSALDVDWAAGSVEMDGMAALDRYRERNARKGPPVYG